MIAALPAQKEAEAEAARCRMRMEELERHVAEESTAKTAAQESAVAAKQEAADKTAAAEQEAADREARAADSEAEAAEAQAAAAALAARISGLVEENLQIERNFQAISFLDHKELHLRRRQLKTTNLNGQLLSEGYRLLLQLFSP